MYILGSVITTVAGYFVPDTWRQALRNFATGSAIVPPLPRASAPLVPRSTIRPFPRSSLSPWDSPGPACSETKMKFVTLDAYLCFAIGKKLLPVVNPALFNKKSSKK
ncbi:hypothetical protein Droror1_Dr00025943 [Drosera rotundifolia]